MGGSARLSTSKHVLLIENNKTIGYITGQIFPKEFQEGTHQPINEEAPLPPRSILQRLIATAVYHHERCTNVKLKSQFTIKRINACAIGVITGV